MTKPHSFFASTDEFECAGGRLAIRIEQVHTSEIAARNYIPRADKYTAARLSAAHKKETHDE